MPQIQIPYKLNFREYQVPLWNATVHENFKRAMTVWPRRNGKDLTYLNIAMAKAIQRTGLYLYIAPYYEQVRKIIWEGMTNDGRRFLDYIPPEAIKGKLNDTRMRIPLFNGSVVQLCGSDNMDSLVGQNPLGAVFTEFSLHKVAAWHYLSPIFADNGGWAFFNGTPRGLNHMHGMACMAEKNPDWFYQHLTRDDTGYPTLEAIEKERRSGIPESIIQQEYYCSWTASSEDVIIPLDILEPCLHTQLTPRDYDFAARIMGVDVAFSPKGDEASICRRQGRLVHPLENYRGMDNMALANRIARLIEDWRPHAVFIDAGRGEGVYSRLYQINPAYQNIVIPVNAGGTVYSPLYANKKAEMWFLGRDFFLRANRPFLPEDRQLLEELSAPTWIYQEGSGKILVESKLSLKKRSVASPNRAEAFLLTFAEPTDDSRVLTAEMERQGVTQEVLDVLRQTQDQEKQDYDPLRYFNR